MTGFTNEDEFIHQNFVADPDQPWKENWYFNFIDKDAEAYGMFHVSLQRHIGVGMFRCAHLIKGTPHLYDNLIDINESTSEISDGVLTFEIIEPFHKHKVTYRGDGYQLEIDYTSRSEILDSAEGAEADKKSIHVRHYEQSSTFTGTLTINNEKHAIKGLGHRDHTWGFRNENFMKGWSWIAAQFPDFTVNVGLVDLGPDIPAIAGGHIYGDNHSHNVVGVKLIERQQDDARYPELTNFELEDDSGTIWNLESKRFDKLIVPMREKENGYVYQTFADFSLNEGEHIGYGIEEWMTNADNVARWERPEWLTHALRKASAISETVEVTDATAEVLVGGFMGSTYRIHLKYKNSEGGEPATVVGKFPTVNPSAREVAKQMSVYSNEVNFYRELGHRLPIKVPKAYLAEINETTQEFSLLLEDINPATVPSVDDKNALDIACQAMNQLSILQASSWDGKLADDLTWIKDITNNEVFAMFKHGAQKGWQILQSVLGEDLAPQDKDVVDSVLAGVEIWREKATVRACLAHCDYRLGNQLVTQDGELVTLDWQGYMFSNPGTDVAHFLVASLNGEKFLQWQEQLRTHYFDSLISSGVTGYTRQQADADLQIGYISEAMMILATCSSLGEETIRGPARAQMTQGFEVLMLAIRSSDALAALQ